MEENVVGIHNYFENHEIETIKSISDNYGKAFILINRVFREDHDLSGNPTFGHMVRVSDSLESDDEKVIGLLHDIVEDKKATFEDLLMLGFPKYIVNRVAILTRDKTIFPDYHDYITSVMYSNDIIAIKVKIADMEDNLSPLRINLLKPYLKWRQTNKYMNELPRLKEYLKYLEEKENLKRERKIVA